MHVFVPGTWNLALDAHCEYRATADWDLQWRYLSFEGYAGYYTRTTDRRLAEPALRQRLAAWRGRL